MKQGKNTKKFLIFALCGIGDVIMLTPTITSIKKNFLDSKITVVLRNSTPKELLENNPYVDKIYNYPEDFIINVWVNWFHSRQKIKDIKNLANEIIFLLKLRKEEYDVSFWAFPGETKRGAIVSLLSGAKIKMGPKYKIRNFKTDLFYDYTIDIGPKTHAVEDNLEYLRKLGASKFEKKLYLRVTKKDKGFANMFIKEHKITKLHKVIGIHPGCDKAHTERRWSIENFVNLVNKLEQDKKNKIILFEGPDEVGILNNFDGSSIIKVSNFKLNRLFAIIGRCNVMVTSDSGLGHIAAALKVPTVTLFGPANPNKTKPYGEGLVINKLEESFYLDNNKRKFLKIEGRMALKKIEVKEVIEAINMILSKK